MDELQHQWQFWTRYRRNYPSWMAWWLSYAKPKIKSFFRWKSKAAYDDFHNEYQRLYAELRIAYDNYLHNPTMLSTINRIKGQMLALQRNFTHMFMRINETHVAGEPMSTFHLGERRRKKTTITMLRSEQGEIINQSDEIQQHMAGYFERLYGTSPVETDEENAFSCDRAVPEHDATNQACMNEITTNEILSAIRTSASRKSPGSDGLPKEFYLRAIDVIHRELNLILNEALSGAFPSEFVNGVLVKKKGAGDSARSYRPISLLNFDYKILSRVLKSRLERVMRAHGILSPAQKCANSERNIYQATLALKDRIAQLIQRGQKGRVVSFDLDHAFDRVDYGFLFRTMCSLGINQDFVALLSQIAEAASSRLMVNGHLSPPFSIQRSVRQGDPLSMHLFVLYLHPLLSRLERICASDLVVAYADDISVVVTSTRKLQHIRTLFARFETVSGARLNLRKTTSVIVGRTDDDEDDDDDVAWLQTANTVKILGVFFTNSIRSMIRINWDSLVTKFTQHVWLHSLRTLTL